MTRTVTLTIPMDYPGWTISKNGLWKGGNRRWGMNKEAKRWRKSLVDNVGKACLVEGVRELAQPYKVNVQVQGIFIDRGMAVDVHNLLELVCDAVQDGLGVDDKYFTTNTLEPYFRVGMPEIVVTVTVEAVG